MSGSARFSLPFLAAGQAQKEFYHNEALQTLDLAVAAAVEEEPRSSPPSSPSVGACYIVAEPPSGEWTGKSQNLAGYTSGGWKYVTPQDGLTAYVKSTGTWACYRSGAWEIGKVRGSCVLLDGVQIIGGQLAAIAGPSGGTVVDSESRTAISQILSALREHGLIAS